MAESRNRTLLRLASLAFAAALLTPPDASAVVIYSDDGPLMNTTDPGDGSGWQLQGSFSGFLATPIAPHHFITAKHIGGDVGTSITFDSGPNAGSYQTIARFSDPASDLRIFEIDGTFNQWAPLYLDSDEVGETLTVFGRGGAGEPLILEGELKGWRWGGGTKSWGRNVVDGISENNGAQLLRFDFDAIHDADEAGLAGGDSGGAVFIEQDGVWKLAGINYAVTGPFRFTETGPSFDAVLFDTGGLWVGNPPQFTPNRDADLPSSAFATRLSARQEWIRSVIPEPTTLALLGVGMVLVGRRRTTRRAD